jgi:hypothetical protein
MAMYEYLPAKAQQFVATMNINTNNLEFLLLESDPHGNFFKHFEGRKAEAVYCKADSTIYFLEYIKVGTAIHELTHYYLGNADYDTKIIGETFIRLHGRQALSNYASISVINDRWDEVICEIVSAYGRRGQFGKIKELFNCFKKMRTLRYKCSGRVPKMLHIC